MKDLNENIIPCTVTETGSQGNYIISFPSGTTWQLGKVYLNNIFQQFIGIHWVGDPETVFPTLTGNNTFTGTNIFSGHNVSFSGFNLTAIADPISDQDAMTLHYANTHYFSTSSGGNWIRNNENQTYSYLLTFDGYSPWLIQYMGEGIGWRRFSGTADDTLMAAPKGYVDSLVNDYCSAYHLWNNTVFDNSQFTFSSTKIHLQWPYNIDSNSMRKLNIYKDTVVSEITIQRNWVLKRPFYSYEDSMSLKWYYYNSAVSSNPLDSFYAINKAYNLRDNDEDISLTTSNSSIRLITLPNNSSALWKVTISFQYLFDFAKNAGSDCYDSITVSFAGKSVTVKCAYPAFTYDGMQGSATLQVLINTKGSFPDENIYGICSQNAISSTKAIERKIKYLRVIAEIIN